MTRWPIGRSWMISGDGGGHELLPTDALRARRACIFLGAAGLGKTYELEYLASLDRERGLDVRFGRLARLGQTADSLERGLARLAEGVTASTVFYLDALDEVMVPVRAAGLIVERWIRETLNAVRPCLRVSCRSAVWSGSVDVAIRDVYGNDDCHSAVLQPLSDEDIRAVAVAQGVDADGFLAAVRSAGALVLAQQPLTLNMLLRVFQADDRLPDRRTDLFAKGMRTLASERSERRRDGTATDMPVDELLEAAELLACVMVLSGRDLVDMSDEPADTSLGVHELGSLRARGRRLDFVCLEAIGRTGLCEGDGGRGFRFAHRQFAEYLAGRRLARLLPHQARAMLASGLGWQAGVAGSLRETAAFAAMESDGVARWVEEYDPEVIGLSDVAGGNLRRRATMKLIEKFRRHELTDTQVRQDGLELAGFRYPGAEHDLAPILRERGDGCDDVLECVIGLIEAWNLGTMSDDLATLVLDAAAPPHARKTAGYALAKIGTRAAKHRLLPLIAGTADDLDLDLKGLALRCNWPDSLSVPELLAAITPHRVANYHGAYDAFLFSLDHAGFDAAGHRVQGLAWAQRFVCGDSDLDPAVRIAKRVAIAALDELDEPGVAEGLARLVFTAANGYADSPLVPPQAIGIGTEPPAPDLAGRPRVRRSLVDAIVAIAPEDCDLWWICAKSRLSQLDDFVWLLSRAADDGLSMTRRKHYATLALWLPWMNSADCVGVWFALREVEPIASIFQIQPSTVLDSEEARNARNTYAERKRRETPEPANELRPSPRERVAEWLAACENEDVRHFAGLCRQMTLAENSTHYGFTRSVRQTPGWAAASDEERGRIVAVAKRFLTSDHEEADLAKTPPLGRLLVGQITAMWLVMGEDPAWIGSLPPGWWRKWTWNFLLEIPPNMHGETEGNARLLLAALHANAPDEVRGVIRTLATSKESDIKSLLSSLLDVLRGLPDPALDDMLCAALEQGQIPEDRVGEVARFVLARHGDRAMGACLARLGNDALATNEAVGARVAVALLEKCTDESWGAAVGLLHRRPDLAVRILGEYAHGERCIVRFSEYRSELRELSAERAGRLFALLLEHFPPENDPDHGGEAYAVQPDDSARHLRDHLISWLGVQKDLAAVRVLRGLERSFGAKYPWLRRPRSRVERAYRLAHWTPIDPHATAEILFAGDKRLIRNTRDALDGVVAAIEDYGKRLRTESPSNIEDLWNRPRGSPATPKEEERISDKICIAVREYFRDFAVVADREVQISRRTVNAPAGGAPGSEVDVKWEVSSFGTVGREAIKIPIEVKLSHNREARTGLKDQLVDRYMPELGTDVGVYVVAWFGTDKDAGYRALWASIDEARNEMPSLVRDVTRAGSALDVRAVVVDATLRVAAGARRGR